MATKFEISFKKIAWKKKHFGGPLLLESHYGFFEGIEDEMFSIAVYSDEHVAKLKEDAKLDREEQEKRRNFSWQVNAISDLLTIIPEPTKYHLVAGGILTSNIPMYFETLEKAKKHAALMAKNYLNNRLYDLLEIADIYELDDL